MHERPGKALLEHAFNKVELKILFANEDFMNRWDQVKTFADLELLYGFGFDLLRVNKSNR